MYTTNSFGYWLEKLKQNVPVVYEQISTESLLQLRCVVLKDKDVKVVYKDEKLALRTAVGYFPADNCILIDFVDKKGDQQSYLLDTERILTGQGYAPKE